MQKPRGLCTNYKTVYNIAHRVQHASARTRHRQRLCGGRGADLLVIIIRFLGGRLLGVELGRLGRGAEVMVDIVGELVGRLVQDSLAGLVDLLLVLGGLPVGAHVIDAVLVVLLRIVVFALTAEAFPQREMLRMDGHTVVVLLAASADIGPAALLLLEVEAGGVGKEEGSDQHAEKAEPRDEVELSLGRDVVVHDAGQ